MNFVSTTSFNLYMLNKYIYDIISLAIWLVLQSKPHFKFLFIVRVEYGRCNFFFLYKIYIYLFIYVKHIPRKLLIYVGIHMYTHISNYCTLERKQFSTWELCKNWPKTMFNLFQYVRTKCIFYKWRIYKIGVYDTQSHIVKEYIECI